MWFYCNVSKIYNVDPDQTAPEVPEEHSDLGLHLFA